MSKKGQALVEFVIILPIFIFMLLSIIDVGMIVYNKNDLESRLSDVTSLYREKKTYDEIKSSLNDDEIKLTILNTDNEKITFKLSKDIDIVTPFLSAILGNPYSLNVERTLEYE